jgi:polyribonucleotide 5'-hydroxyl-kinase
MSLPGLGIPGLNLTTPIFQEPATLVAAPRHQTLNAETEWRFEAPFNSPVTVKVLSGIAELFGTELSPSIAYTFRGTKGAIYTWQGCQLEVVGDTEGEYIAEETPMTQYANVHFALENARNEAKGRGELAPRVLVVGPEDSGKTSLVKILTSYAVKSGRQPVVVSLDMRQGVLSVPGSLTATAMASMLDVEEGWGSSPISGPTAMPVKMPLVYHFGCASAEENVKLYKALLSRLGLAVKSRTEEDEVIRQSGVFIDTPGSISSGKGGNYDLIQHIISEFSVNALLVLGSERLYNDLKKKFSDVPTNPVTVIRLDKSGGCVDREESYMKLLRQAQIKEYFFGHGQIPLSPHTMHADFVHLSIYRIQSSSSTASAASTAFNPGADEDDDDFYEPTATVGKPAAASGVTVLEKVTPSNMMQNSLLAVTFAQPNDSLDVIRDAAVMGYVYVAEVDEAKKKMKLLSPVGGAAPRHAMVWGSWPEEVVSLVS